MIKASRLEDAAFKAGKGPDPATHDNATGFNEGDPLQ
jgi:hypothetical protein